MVDNPKTLAKLGDRLQDLGAFAVVAAIASNEQDIDRPVAIVSISIHLRIVPRSEVFCAPPSISIALQNSRKIADEEIISSEIRIAGWRCSPSDRPLYSPRQLLDEVIAVADRIKIVEDLRAVVLDLTEQHLLRRRVGRKTVFRCPKALSYDVIACGEECVTISVDDRFQQMARPEGIRKENLKSLRKRTC